MKKKVGRKHLFFIILAVGIVIISSLVAILFIYVPFSNKKTALKDDILYERNRNILLGQIKALNSHLEVYEKRLSGTTDVSWLLKDLSDIAGKENIRIVSIKPITPDKLDLYTKIGVTLEVVCSYHELGRFLAKVESSDKFLRIEKIKVMAKDVKKEFGDEYSGLKEEIPTNELNSEIVITTMVNI